jgi:uncharacterized protein YbjQ (UPF0145 family)
VRAKHAGRDIAAGLKNLVGGELKGYTELLTESRRQAIERMMAQAQQLGANAVVNVRFTTSAVTAGATRHRDLMGLGLSWGKPGDDNLDDQYTAEIFYRFQFSRNFAITPGAQMILDPALNPDEDELFFFGLRARLNL